MRRNEVMFIPRIVEDKIVTTEIFCTTSRVQDCRTVSLYLFYVDDVFRLRLEDVALIQTGYLNQ